MRLIAGRMIVTLLPGGLYMVVLALSDTNVKILGSSAINPGAVFLRFFTIAFLLFLTPAGGSNATGTTF